MLQQNNTFLNFALARNLCISYFYKSFVVADFCKYEQMSHLMWIKNKSAVEQQCPLKSPMALLSIALLRWRSSRLGRGEPPLCQCHNVLGCPRRSGARRPSLHVPRASCQRKLLNQNRTTPPTDGRGCSSYKLVNGNWPAVWSGVYCIRTYVLYLFTGFICVDDLMFQGNRIWDTKFFWTLLLCNATWCYVTYFIDQWYNIGFNLVFVHE